MPVNIARLWSVSIPGGTRFSPYWTFNAANLGRCMSFRLISHTSSSCNSKSPPGGSISYSKQQLQGAKSIPYGAKIPRATIPAQQSLRRLAGRLSEVVTEYSHSEEDAIQHAEQQQQLDPSYFLQFYQPCTTVSTCEHYDLAKVIELLYAQGLRSARILLPGEIAHVQYPYSAGRKYADVLILSNGTVVSWGMTEVEVLEKIVPELKESEVRSYKMMESEDMDYIEKNVDQFEDLNWHTNSENRDTESISSDLNGELHGSTTEARYHKEQQRLLPNVTHSTMLGDVIIISGVTGTEGLLAKAAFSSGIARSTKLAALDNHIESTKSLIENLANARELGIRGTKVLQLTGQLLQIRGQLNLYSELIETPDLYWEEPELEALYSLISKRLDVAPRIAILNKKLDYASESVNILKSHLSEEQGVRLEWMIIILIMVEVGFEIFHFMERYMESSTKEEKPFSTSK